MAAFKSIAGVLDFAIAREVEAHAFYVGLAEQVTDPTLRETLQGFALDEWQHGIRLQAIKAGQAVFLDDDVGSLEIAETLSQIQPHPNMSYKELLILAMNREKTSFRIYSNLASIAKRPDCRDTLLQLAQEEARHKLRLEIEYDLVTF